MRDIIKPTVDGMAAEGCPFTGVIFAGLMISKDGKVKLLEHNIRFGDPECQVLMARMTSDLTELLLAAATGKLDEARVDVARRLRPGCRHGSQRIPGLVRQG
jgi:phosphoribosylamine--glycine ligase